MWWVLFNGLLSQPRGEVKYLCVMLQKLEWVVATL